MKNTDIAYAAGLIDGEGCFSITRYVSGKNNVKYRACLVVQMNDESAPTFLKDLFGGVLNKGKRCHPYEDTFRWSLNERALVYAATRELLPYLKVKKLSAIITMEFCQKFPSTRYKAIGEEVKEEMAKYCEFISVANGRGPGSTERKTEFLRLITSA